jgi:hypothetical protein
MKTTSISKEIQPPPFWTVADTGAGEQRIVYAVRGGMLHLFITSLGVALIAAGGWGMIWLGGGGLTIAGVVFMLLVPGGAILSGVYCLDRMWWARSEYILSSQMFSARTYSLFGNKHQDIPRSAIRAIVQYYTPPSASASRSHEGEWVSFIRWRDPTRDKAREFAMEGMHSSEERNWLGPLLANWAKVELTRGFSASAEEVDPSELPE